MRRLFGSFYVRIALVYLALILVLGAGVVAIGFDTARMLFDEVEQRLNRGYAASIAGELAPLLDLVEKHPCGVERDGHHPGAEHEDQQEVDEGNPAVEGPEEALHGRFAAGSANR